MVCIILWEFKKRLDWVIPGMGECQRKLLRKEEREYWLKLSKYYKRSMALNRELDVSHRKGWRKRSVK